MSFLLLLFGFIATSFIYSHVLYIEGLLLYCEAAAYVKI